MEPKRIADVMGGRAVLRKSVTSLKQLEEIVGDGLPKEALRVTVRRVFDQASDVTRHIYRIVPEATYKRRRGKLRAIESERTERLARVIAAAESVWDDQSDAREWLTTPHPELNGRKPVECALSELGARQVEDVLDRLQYGLPL